MLSSFSPHWVEKSNVPAILFDLGGTHLRCAVEHRCAAVSSASLSHRQKCRIPNFLNARSADEVWDGILRIMSEYVAGINGAVAQRDPIVVGFPGPIDPDGNIVAAPTIIGGDGRLPDFRGKLAALTRRPVFLLNDMSAAAWRLSATTKARRFVIVTVSSGIGSKVFDAGSPIGVIDDKAFAGEIGHVIVDSRADAPLCDCGGRGHLGAIASGRGIERAATRAAMDDPAAFKKSLCVTKFGADETALRNEDHLVPAALEGDEWALSVISRCTEPLGRVLATLTAAMGLDLIAVMGGFAQSMGSAYVKILEGTMRDQDHFPGFPKFKAGFIELHPPDDEVCLLGAATYAHKRLGVA
jgi:glucokinase